ncbi:MAG TPA: thioesterase family protein [Myxococcales bacterium]
MLEVGMKQEETRVVTEEDSAARISPRVPPVYASARMIGFAEVVCADLMAPHLAPGETSVGVGFQFTHEAATPIGMKVTMRATLAAIEGKKYVFEVEGRDEVDRICVGRHERAIIKQDKFMARLAEKAKKAQG